MIADIVEINRDSPYQISLGEESESFTFATENGLEYRASFVPNSDLFKGLVVMFFSLSSPDWSTGERHVFDPKVRETVFQILKNVLSRNDQVVAYICSDDDGRKKHRYRLFSTWFLQTSRIFTYKYIVRPVEYSAEGISLYGGMIFRLDNPLREQYLDALYQYMQLLYEDKS